MIQTISFLAFFTILCHIGIVFQWSFATLANLSFIPVICTLALYSFLKFNKLRFVENDCEEINRNKFDNIYAVIAIAIVLALAIFPYISDTDEAFYSSVENHALENPDLPYLKYDGMFGDEGREILHISYKVQSFQMLSAVASYWFGIPNLIPRHVFFPMIVSMLFLITWIKILKLFIPRRWQLGLFFFVIYLLIEGSYRGLTSFSVLRFFDGKCVLFFVIMPLVFYYSIIFFRAQNYVCLLYLFVIQIAGVGLSSSALYLLPLQLFIMSLCYWKPNYEQTRKCILLGLSCIYVFIVAVIMKILIDFHSVEGVIFD